MDALRPFGIPPGDYMVPRAASTLEMGSMEFIQKTKKGPVMLVTVRPNGSSPMWKNLALWFLFSSVAYVAEEHGMIVGFGNLTQDGWVDMLYTHKSHQGEGIASAILTRLTEDAGVMRLPALHVTASIAARHFFEIRGFSLDWEQDKAHKGSVFKSFVMTKDLRA